MRSVTPPLQDKAPRSLAADSSKVDPGLSHHLWAPAEEHHEHACAGKSGATCCGQYRRRQPIPGIILPNE